MKRQIITLLSVFTAMFTFGIGSALADPVLPRAPVGSTEILVPAHYGYHHGHRVFIPAHYVVYTGGCMLSKGGYYVECSRYRYVYRVF